MKIGPIPLWSDGQVPGGQGTGDSDVPSITVYTPTGLGSTRAAVVVCPGGGYGHLAPHEATPVADWLNSFGVTGVVLKYRLAPRYQHPAMLNDVSRAMRTVRARAAEWNLDPNHIGVLGFSAGGHLASTVSNHYDAGDRNASDPIERQPSRPDMSILIYPVIDLEGRPAHAGSRRNLLGENPSPALVTKFSNHKAVTARTPPTFLVHSSDDKAVPVENSLRYALALEEAGVPFAMQVYEKGGHGYGMGKPEFPETPNWPEACARWMKTRGFLG
jgi:acetyl esterase/lipase